MTTKKTTTSTKKLSNMLKGRPKPSAPRAGVLASGRRYGCGGKKTK